MPDREPTYEDILFVALLRPATKFGVPTVGILMNLVGSVLFGAWAGLVVRFSLLYAVAVFGVVHFLMRHLTDKDHNMFRIKMLWMETKGRSIASFELWGGSTLTPLPSRWPRKAVDLPVNIGWDDGT